MNYNKVFFFVHDGIYCAHTGVGIHNRRFMRLLRGFFADAEIVIAPTLTSRESADFQADWFEETLCFMDKGNLTLMPVDNGSAGIERYGSLATWKKNALAAEKLLVSNASDSDKVLAVSVDTPFIGLIPLLAEYSQITHLHIPHSSGKLHTPSDSKRIDFEKACLQTKAPNTFIGATCEFMRDHLISEYGTRPRMIIPVFNDYIYSDYKKSSNAEMDSVIKSWSIKPNRELIVSYGRAVPYKGFHTLIKALDLLPRDKFQLLINATTVDEKSGYIAHLKALVEETGVDAIIKTRFDSALPAKFQQLPKVLAVVVPSIHEPFGLIPSEVMANKYNKAILVCSNADGLKKQIVNSVNGYTFIAENIDDLASTIRHITEVPSSDRAALVAAAHRMAIEKSSLETIMGSAFQELAQRLHTL